MVHNQLNRFRHISQEERVEIYTFLREGLSCREIARRLDRSHSTISREIDRNSIDYGWGKVIYKPLQAEKKKYDRKEVEN